MFGDVTYRLGVDEIGMAMIAAGKNEEAAGFMFATLGAIDETEMRGRLFAATNSLLAKELAIWSDADGEIRLTTDLKTTVEILGRPSFSVRFSRIEGGFEHITTYHFTGDGIVQQSSDNGLVHELRVTQGPDDVIGSSSQFLSFNNVSQFDAGQAVFPVETLDTATDIAPDGQDELARHFEVAGATPEMAGMLASDYARQVFSGYVMRIDYTEDGVDSDRGFRTLYSAERAWIFNLESQDGHIMARTIAGTEANFETTVRQLIEE